MPERPNTSQNVPTNSAVALLRAAAHSKFLKVFEDRQSPAQVRSKQSWLSKDYGFVCYDRYLL